VEKGGFVVCFCSFGKGHFKIMSRKRHENNPGGKNWAAACPLAVLQRVCAFLTVCEHVCGVRLVCFHWRSVLAERRQLINATEASLQACVMRSLRVVTTSHNAAFGVAHLLCGNTYQFAELEELNLPWFGKQPLLPALPSLTHLQRLAISCAEEHVDEKDLSSLGQCVALTDLVVSNCARRKGLLCHVLPLARTLQRLSYVSTQAPLDDMMLCAQFTQLIFLKIHVNKSTTPAFAAICKALPLLQELEVFAQYPDAETDRIFVFSHIAMAVFAVSLQAFRWTGQAVSVQSIDQLWNALPQITEIRLATFQGRGVHSFLLEQWEVPRPWNATRILPRREEYEFVLLITAKCLYFCVQKKGVSVKGCSHNCCNNITDACSALSHCRPPKSLRVLECAGARVLGSARVHSVERTSC
jgi:hypothetical protein